ncbi:MAG TPA: glycosyltransferase family 4 protein [Anaerolineales bacterium]|jgi:glycosyltransferase involved in cell wall biosynthesis|nr:glycosyltransferase family 4 protein [Anaerolineales bacterium]
MHLLFIVDARSPIAMNWIRHFIDRGDEVYIASTFPVQLDISIKRLEVFPVAFSSIKKPSQRPGSASARTLSLRTKIRQWFGPLTLRRSAQRLQEFITEVKPDLVHAMRIPYEGMLAADAYDGSAPLVVSIWGNDFTLHAPSTPLMRHYTKWTMSVADGLHSDCQRDVRLAKQWGFSVDKPSLVAPGNGGIRSEVFYPPEELVQAPVILNPRGVRPYVRNNSFFKAIPLVLEKHPKAKFLCTGMQGEAQAIQWTKELGIEGAVELLAPIPNAEMADLYRRAQILVSPSIHDGTPNTLLEGMACGCFPVAGDLESIREWISPNENGLLFDSTNSGSIADAIIEGIESKSLREKAAGLNGELISARAEYKNNMLRAEEFYKSVIRDL